MRSTLPKGRWVAVFALTAGCATGQPVVAQVPPVARPGAVGDTLDPNWVPAGFGSLRQDDISIKVSPSSGLQVRATPLDERMIRLLSPDSYRALKAYVTSQEAAINAVRERNRLPSYSIWVVSFFALEQGETRFSPQEFIISNTGRDFRPLDVLPLTSGFGNFRLRQRDVQSALYIFDGQLDVNQPTTAMMEGTSSVTDWARVMRDVERQRALVRSRAAAKPPAVTPPGA